MSLLRPWWLGGLALLLPLVVLHLRRPALTVREVPSLLVWERISGTASSDTRRLRRPRHPLLLALQALVLAALVVALAGPRWDTGSAAPATVYVVDGSFWMQAGTRLDAARADLLRAATRGSGRVAVVSAGAVPAVLYDGSRSGLARHLDHLSAGATSGDLAAAITLGAGLLGGVGGRMVVVRAPEDSLPVVDAAPGQLESRVVGAPLDDQGLFAPQARCGVGPDDECEVLATLRNGSTAARVDSYTASVEGQQSVSFRESIPARSSETITLTAQPASTLRLQLHGHDALAADDAVLVSVPGTDNAPDAATVTLVGDPTSALPLAQAFASIPGVTLLLRTPRSYRAGDARRSELVVLDGVSPAAGLPAAPAVLLIAPASIPGGSVGAPIAAPVVSSTEPGSELLQGVDLTSLSVDRGAASVLTLPPWMRPIVSSPAGPLLAAGSDGNRRVAVLAFDLPRSNLSQLPALPILARNVVAWADGWASLGDDGSLTVAALPGATRATLRVAGHPTRTFSLAGGPAGVTDLRPGIASISVASPGAVRQRTLASALGDAGSAAKASPAASIDLVPWSIAPPAAGRRTLASWLIVLALAALSAEWVTWRRISR